MSDLRNKISELASEFTDGIMAAIRTVSLDDLSGEGTGEPAAAAPRRGRPPGPAKVKAAGSSGRLARRSPEQLEVTIQSIVGALKKAPDGLGSEALQSMLGIEKREITGPLKLAIETRVLSKRGNKRATVYLLGGKKTTKSPKKSAAKTGKAKAKKPKAAKKTPAKKSEAPAAST